MNEPRLQRQPFEAKKLVLDKLVSMQGDDVYVIPPFQRPYRWSNDQVDRLVQDLLDFYEIQWNSKSDKAASEYSLGTIVCDRKSSCFAILDGQQRLTTIDLLLAVIAEKRGLAHGKRLIASYQYLPDCESKTNSDLPPHIEQKKVIDAVLRKHFEDIDEKTVPWAEFEACLRQKVYVTRVTLPLAGGRIKGEAAKMFEIINVTGQKLSLLDQIKARLLSVFSEEQKAERAIVSRFWDALPELLNHPERAANGFDFNYLTPDDGLLKEETLADILGRASYSDFIATQKQAKTTTEENQNRAEDQKPQKQVATTQPPIDMGNLLVVANELLRYSMKEDSSQKSTPALTLSDGHFDWLMVEKSKNSKSMPSAEKVLRLIGTSNLVLQIIGNWGVYRQRGDNSADIPIVGELTPMRALQLSFMAENRFQNEAQYWLLMLVANTMGRPIFDQLEDWKLDERPVTPDTFKTNWSLSAKKLGAISQHVFRRLIGWAVHRAFQPETGIDAAVRWGIMSDTMFQTEFENDIQLLRRAVYEWQYGNGLRHWQLYLLDWLLWNDGKHGLTYLKETLSSFKTQNARVENALRSFQLLDFEKIWRNFRFVRHGAIEHWFPREMANEDADKLRDLNGIGNLALIDTSLNSTLRNLPVNEKTRRVMNNNANHSLKLGWLAVFTALFPEYDWSDVADVTDFWGVYLSSYPFGSL